MRTWSLPQVGSRSGNVCGECTECCTFLPINDGRGWVKAPGQPCEHLCQRGCSIYDQERWPDLCRNYLCYWRAVGWLGEQADCGPDRLGVIFQDHGDLVALFETRPQAAYAEKVCRIVRKMRMKFKGREKLRVNVYPYQGVHWRAEIACQPEFISNQLNWVCHQAPYEHFIMEVVSGPPFFARDILAFFAANLHRDVCVIRIGDYDLCPRIERRSIPELEAIASGKPPGGELAWLAEVGRDDIEGGLGGLHAKKV